MKKALKRWKSGSTPPPTEAPSSPRAREGDKTEMGSIRSSNGAQRVDKSPFSSPPGDTEIVEDRKPAAPAHLDKPAIRAPSPGPKPR